MKQKQVKHSVKRVISAVLTFCLIAFIILSLVVVVKTTLADDPSVLGFRFFYIISGSMEPTVPISAAVITKQQAEYTVGDIITFRSSDPAILDCPNTHRIVSVIVDNGLVVYQTKGDANNTPDADLVPYDDVFGKVILITPPLNSVGKFLEFLLTPSGFFILLVIPMLLVTVCAMKEFAKNCQAALRQQLEEQANVTHPREVETGKTQNGTSVESGGELTIDTTENTNEKGSGTNGERPA